MFNRDEKCTTGKKTYCPNHFSSFFNCLNNLHCCVNAAFYLPFAAIYQNILKCVPLYWEIVLFSRAAKNLDVSLDFVVGETKLSSGETRTTAVNNFSHFNIFNNDYSRVITIAKIAEWIGRDYHMYICKGI